MRIIKQLFGERWLPRILWTLLATSIITLWPLLIFYNDLHFDKMDFTKDWIKTCASLSIIFLFVEFQKAKLEIRKQNVGLRYTLEKDILNPVKIFLYSVQVEDHSEQKENEIFQSWLKLEKELSEHPLSEYSTRLNNESLSDFMAAFGIDTLDAEIRQMYANNQPPDRQKIIQVLSQLIEALDEELKDLK